MLAQREKQGYEEKKYKGKNGYGMLFLLLVLLVASVTALVFGFMQLADGSGALGGVLLGGGVLLFLLSLLGLCGLRVISPKEALVLTLFGKYVGTLREEGFFWINPFCSGVNPSVGPTTVTTVQGSVSISGLNKKISLKTMTLNNEKQTVNDELGNPIIIGTIVIWRVVDTAKAVFNVNNYKTYLSTQCDSAIRNVTRMYPYDVAKDGDEKSLRGSSQEVAETLKTDLQARVDTAGLEIMEVRITHLSYAPEIAAAMLQRQQAEAIIAARQKIVEGAVRKEEMALRNLSENGVVELDEERKAAMVSNLMVVLCGNRDAQPVVNSGSIY